MHSSQYVVDALPPLIAYRTCIRLLSMEKRRYSATFADIAVAAREVT